MIQSLESSKKKPIYSREIPVPDVTFTQAELFDKDEDDEGMYDCSLLDKESTPIPAYLQRKQKNPAPPMPKDDCKMPPLARSPTKKAKKLESVGIVSPPACAHMPIKLKSISEYKGTNKMERFLHQMQVQQNLILSKFGIDAPILDLSGLNDSEDDSGLTMILTINALTATKHPSSNQKHRNRMQPRRQKL